MASQTSRSVRSACSISHSWKVESDSSSYQTIWTHWRFTGNFSPVSDPPVVRLLAVFILKPNSSTRTYSLYNILFQSQLRHNNT